MAAYTDTSVADVGTVIGDGVSNALGTISGNMPTVFGVSIAWVAWKVGRKVLGHI